MCNDLRLLQDITPITEPIRGISGTLQTTAKGTAVIRSTLSTGRTVELTFYGLLYLLRERPCRRQGRVP